MISSNKDALYVQLMNNIKEKIVKGEYRLGDKIMSEREMAAQYQINRLTVRRAIKKLIEEGCLRSCQGKGTFVCKVPSIEGKIKLGSDDNVSLRTTIKQGGMKSSRIVLKMEKTKPDEEIHQFFPDSEQVYRLVRLSLVNDVPYALQETFFPCSVFKEAERFNFEENSLYDYMDMQGHYPYKVLSYLQIRPILKEYEELLDMKAGKHVFYFDYFGFDQAHAIIEYTRSYHRPEYSAVKYVTKDR